MVRRNRPLLEKVVQNSAQRELDKTIYELPDPPRLELVNGLLNSLGVHADNILDQKFVNRKQQEDAIFEQIKEEYNFDEIKDAFDEATVPHQIFSMVGRIVILTRSLNFYRRAMKIENLLHFYLIRDKV